jgi:hypothetical protein
MDDDYYHTDTPAENAAVMARVMSLLVEDGDNDFYALPSDDSPEYMPHRDAREGSTIPPPLDDLAYPTTTTTTIADAWYPKPSAAGPADDHNSGAYDEVAIAEQPVGAAATTMQSTRDTSQGAQDRQRMVESNSEGWDAGDVDALETHPERLEALAHAGLFFAWIALLLAFSHWNHVAPLLSVGTLLVVSAVAMYDLFMRRSEHRAVQTLLVVWTLWLLYSVLSYALHFVVEPLWLMAARDALLSLQIVVLVAFRMLPMRITQSEYGAQVGRRLMDLLGHERVNKVRRAAESVQVSVTRDYPARLSGLDNGASMRAGKELERDCFSFRMAMRQNLGLWYLSSDSPAGFILFQLLVAIPFAQNSAVGYNPYWAVARLAASFVLYKLIDAVFRPRMPGGEPQVSAPTIVTLAQFPLYTHQYVMVAGSFVLAIVFSFVCYTTYADRAARAAADGADGSMAEFRADDDDSHASTTV